MTFENLTHSSSAWLEEGPSSDIILSSRIRLARNLAPFPFTHRATPEQLREVQSLVQKSSQSSSKLSGSVFLPLSTLAPLDRQFLQERHLISHDLANQERDGAVVVGEREITSVMVNEEDHLRLQSILPGFQLRQAFEITDELDDELGRQLDFAFSEEWGFLTACPTNAGTGMRASVLIHLPALVLTKQIDRVLRGISQVGLYIRGMYGEGSEVMGNFFQISNQATLGRSEEDIIESLENVTKQIIEYETKARETLRETAEFQVVDKIWRAYGIMKNARLITSDEVTNLSSALRLGVSMGVMDRVDIRVLNELLVFTQPAHLQKLLGREMDPEERDFHRAAYVRERLQ